MELYVTIDDRKGEERKDVPSKTKSFDDLLALCAKNFEVTKALYDNLIGGEERPASKLFVSDRISFGVFLTR